MNPDVSPGNLLTLLTPGLRTLIVKAKPILTPIPVGVQPSGAFGCGQQGNASVGVSRRLAFLKNEAKQSGICPAYLSLAEMRNGPTKKAEILFKKTLTQNGVSEKLSPHTE